MKEGCTSKDFMVMKFQFMAKLSIFLLGMSFLYFFAVTFIKIPDGNVGNSNTIVGFIILTVGVVSGYYFGSSQSTSARQTKDEEQDPVAATATVEAAKLEAERIEAARVEAEKKEAARLETAKAEAAKVIEKAKEEVKP